jgi:hypothetical protein
MTMASAGDDFLRLTAILAAIVIGALAARYARGRDTEARG